MLAIGLKFIFFIFEIEKYLLLPTLSPWEYRLSLFSVIPVYSWTRSVLLPFYFAKCNKHQLGHITSIPISPEKYSFIRWMICLINYCIRCGGKCLIASSPEKQKAVICGISQFHWCNSPTKADSSYRHSFIKPGVGKKLSVASQLQHPTDCRWWPCPMVCHASHKAPSFQSFSQYAA